jgi:hypothetical protein
MGLLLTFYQSARMSGDLLRSRSGGWRGGAVRSRRGTVLHRLFRFLYMLLSNRSRVIGRGRGRGLRGEANCCQSEREPNYCGSDGFHCRLSGPFQEALCFCL